MQLIMCKKRACLHRFHKHRLLLKIQVTAFKRRYSKNNAKNVLKILANPARNTKSIKNNLV